MDDQDLRSNDMAAEDAKDEQPAKKRKKNPVAPTAKPEPSLKVPLAALKFLFNNGY